MDMDEHMQENEQGNNETDVPGNDQTAAPSNMSKETSNKGTPKKPSTGRKTSYVWDHFTENKDPKFPRAVCNYCGVSYASKKKRNGTSNMRAHLENQCKKYPLRVNRDRQSLLNFKTKQGADNTTPTSYLKAHVYNYDSCRKSLAKMIIRDELPFRFVEGEGFIAYSNTLEPRFTLPKRVTLARDCMQIYGEERAKLRLILKNQRVCLTTDTWSSIQNFNYMCLTAHWIDSDWRLQKRIINFRQVANHKGETIGRCVESWLLEWGNEKIFTLTADNASSNNIAIEELKRKTKRWKHIILDNEFLHVRCCAHILNLVVRDGLDEEIDSITRIRNAIRYVRSSPARLLSFQKCVEKEKLESKKNLCLDVETRWNSTYLMLEIAEKYEKAFVRLGEDDSKYASYFDGSSNKDPPSDYDWLKARIFIKFLKIFYQATLKFSGSLYVTSNTFFHEIVEIHANLSNLMSSGDILLSRMAERMKLKFEKYWENYKNINFLLYIAVVLDPRFKLRYVQFCFSQLYDNRKCPEMIQHVESALNKLFAYYELEHSKEQGNFNQTDVQEKNDAGCDNSTTMTTKFLEQMREDEQHESKSDLCQYLAEPLVREADTFDILSWWKVNSSKYPVLSKMARDVLVVPVSTVLSESAFSTSGRILNSYRSSLRPKTVETLVCAQNWIRSNERAMELQEIIDDLESFEELAGEFVRLNLDEDLDG